MLCYKCIVLQTFNVIKHCYTYPVSNAHINLLSARRKNSLNSQYKIIKLILIYLVLFVTL